MISIDSKSWWTGLRRRFIWSLLLILVNLGWTAIAVGQNTVRLTNGEWPPFLSRSLKYNGLISRIVSEAFSSQGITVTYGFFEWDEALRLARTGEWDGSLVWSRNQDRDTDFYFSDPVMSDDVVFFHLKDFNFSWTTVEDLAGYRIGVTESYFYGDAFDALPKNRRISVVRSGSDESNFEKILNHEIQIFPCNIEVGYNILYNTFDLATFQRVTNNHKVLHSRPLFLILSRKIPDNRKRIGAFNRGLVELKASGKFDFYFEESRQGKYRPSFATHAD